MKTKGTKLVLVLAAGIVLLGAAPGWAVSYVEENWEGGNVWDIDGYGAASASGQLSYQTTGGPDGSGDAWLQIIDPGGISAGERDVIFDFQGSGSLIEAGGSDLGSDYPSGYGEGIVGITFDFYSDSGAVNPSPAVLAVYFYGASTYWRYVIYDGLFDPLDQGWNTGLGTGWINGTGAGWQRMSGGADFSTAYASVSEIGIELTYTGVDDETYGIDNFRLHYPEPGTYAVLGFALLSLGVTFRGKVRDGLKALKRS